MSTVTRFEETALSPHAPVHQPLGSSDQPDRIRAALGLARGPLPEVDAETLDKYFAYLAARLSFPFDADYPEDLGILGERMNSATVIALVDPKPNIRDGFGGIYVRARKGTQTFELPLAELEIPQDDPNYQLIEDYWYWLWNWR